jgi:hypothetical protein
VKKDLLSRGIRNLTNEDLILVKHIRIIELVAKPEHRLQSVVQMYNCPSLSGSQRNPHLGSLWVVIKVPGMPLSIDKEAYLGKLNKR